MLKQEIERTKMYDANALFWNYPTSRLMESAGRGVAKNILNYYGDNKKIGFFCGPGNNGGDGMVAARVLSSNAQVGVYLPASAEKIKSNMVFDNWQQLGCEKYENVSIEDLPTDLDIIVDCLFGAGIENKLREPYKSLVSALNKLDGKKVSVDIPSPGFKAERVISLMTPKTETAEVIDINYPDWLKRRVGPGDVKLLNKPEHDSHKGKNGKVLIIGGSDKYHGAVLLSSRMASKVVDLVYASSTKTNNKLMEKMKPEMEEFITVERNKIGDFIKEADVVLMGPGLGRGEEEKKMVKDVLKNYPQKKTVLDADALVLASKKDLRKNVLVTPHENEFKKLFGFSPTEENVNEAAVAFGGVVLLKGETDYISNGEEVKVNKVGNAGMTKGGTGDVLAGLSAALSANNEIFLSARAAAFLNGFAADRLEEKVSYYFNASDLVEEIPRALRWCEQY